MDKLTYFRNRRDLAFLDAKAYFRTLQNLKGKQALLEALSCCDLIHHLSCREGLVNVEDLRVLYEIGSEAAALVMLSDKDDFSVLAPLVSILENLLFKGLMVPGADSVFKEYALGLEKRGDSRASRYYRKAISCIGKDPVDPDSIYLGYLRTANIWDPEYALMFEPCYQAIEIYSLEPYEKFSEFYSLRSTFFQEIGNLERALEDIKTAIRFFHYNYSSLIRCTKFQLLKLIRLYEKKDEIETALEKKKLNRIHGSDHGWY